MKIIQIACTKDKVFGLDKDGKLYEWKNIPDESSKYIIKNMFFAGADGNPNAEIYYSKYNSGWVLKEDNLNNLIK